MIVRQLSPWTPAWTAPNATYAQMRREMESLMDRLTGAAGDGQAAGVFPPVNVAEDGDHYYVRALVPGLDPSQLDVSVVNQTVTAQIVNKLLHLPTVRLKEAAVTPDGLLYADAVRHLFGLEEEGEGA